MKPNAEIVVTDPRYVELINETLGSPSQARVVTEPSNQQLDRLLVSSLSSLHSNEHRVRLASFVRGLKAHVVLVYDDQPGSHLVLQALATLASLTGGANAPYVAPDEAALRRVIRAWGIGAREKLIASAALDVGTLVVWSCEPRRYEARTAEIKALAGMNADELSRFEVSPSGGRIHWVASDVDLDLEAIRVCGDPDARQAHEITARQEASRYGDAIRLLREERGLKQTDIEGLTDRQVRRLEQGKIVPHIETLEKLASAHGTSIDDYLRELAGRSGRRSKKTREAQDVEQRRTAVRGDDLNDVTAFTVGASRRELPARRELTTATSTELAEGTIVGEWRIGRPLGRGGQGAVWTVRAVGIKHAPPRALKASFSADDRARARFDREVALLKECASPHVLSLIESHLHWAEHVPTAPAFAYYVAEKCEGAFDDPKVVLGDARRRLMLFHQACLGVVQLHSRPDPVIHRDIKPSNFLLATEPERVVLADFGIARNELADSDLTATREVVGSQYFRAPEILNGAVGSVLSDVYSLGRVLEWLLTGDVSRDLGTRAVPRGQDLEDDACDVLDRVIVKATQAIPTGRFSSVEQMVAQLPELWISVKPKPKSPEIVAVGDARAVFSSALELARKSDRIGWWQLHQHLRRTFPEHALAWRSEAEKASVRTPEELIGLADRLFDAASSRFAMALAGVVSQQSGFEDQRQAVDDLLAIPGWNQGGRVFAVQAPRGLVYVLQHLHGALCCHLRRFDLALQLAVAQASRQSVDDTDQLWRIHDLTGWPKLFGGACTDAWRYVVTIRERKSWLHELFALPPDYTNGLAAYSMLLTLVELAHDSKKLLTSDPDELKTLRLDVPPMFVELGHDTMRAAARRVFGERSVVNLVAEQFDAKHEDLRTLWPKWKRSMQHYYGQIDRSYFGDDWPLGDLA